jgi:hypothetical protein
MLDEIRPEGKTVSTEKEKEYARAYAAKKRAEKRAQKLATGQALPKEPKPAPATASPGRPKSVVNRVTEYGALFNKLNDEHIAKGFPPLKTAMEVLIEAMQSDELDIKDKAKIADKLAPFESSRAPIISIEHVQNISKEEEVTADDALEDFMESLRKV